MTHSSEWVSVGHPDKLADYITSYILDRYLEADPLTRYAVECMVKDRHVFLAGEVTSRARFSYKDLDAFVKTAVLRAGYDRAYEERWGCGNAVCGDDMLVEASITSQSPDIAHGVDAGGWGDQGIFWGMAVADPGHDYLPADYYHARALGRKLHASALGGIDVKTLVTTDEGGSPVDVVAAVPARDDAEAAAIGRLVRDMFPECGRVTVNGTGSYRVHGPVGDCGVTGRKLACDLYGGNCRVGGGSPWGKDATKADVTLNLLARRLARQAVRRGTSPTVYCSIACCIGLPDIRVELMDGGHRPIDSYILSHAPEYYIEQLDLREPRFERRCRDGILDGV